MFREVRLTVVVLLATLVGTPIIAQTYQSIEELKFEFTTNTAEGCLEHLAEFNWLCSQFVTPNWERVFDYSFWDRAEISGIRIDLDEDDHADLILRLGHTGYCGTAGCMNMFLFGGLPPQGLPFGYGINSLEPILFIIKQDGISYVHFGLNGHLFPIQELRQRTLSSHQYTLGD